jgi:hypothetical protein
MSYYIGLGVDMQNRENAKTFIDFLLSKEAQETLGGEPARKTGGIFPRLSIFESGPSEGNPESIRERGRIFGRAAGGRIIEILSGARVVGVAWGSTLNFLTDGLPPVQSRSSRAVVQFVPICAELVALEEPDYGSGRKSEASSRRFAWVWSTN